MHGIETWSPRTWNFYEPTGDPAGRGINWLCDDDMLPRVVPQARIWVYDYNSFYSENAQRVRLKGLGENFIRFIEQEETLGTRPLVLIGSCFGGLVVAQVRIGVLE